MLEDLHRVGTPGVNFYILRDRTGLILIDAGFIGGRFALRRAIRARGWEKEPIVGIIVTHGHLDHICHVGQIAKETGAWIAAPRLDLPHYLGTPTYAGMSQVTGALERMGRPLFKYVPFTPDRLLDDGDHLDVWHGLQVVHLPGHTAGHSGFYCQTLRLLFSADLFASGPIVPQYPPDIFNSFPAAMPASVDRALALDIDGILPNHGDNASPAIHLRRLRHLREKS